MSRSGGYGGFGNGGDYVCPIGLHAVDPYVGFEARPLLMEGWQSDDAIFGELIGELRPRLIVEVGTWLGASAVHMAGECFKRGVESRIVCVDTWLGALEFWTDHADEQRFGRLNLVHGFPSVYYQFLSNVVQMGHADRIIPFPQTSLIAARWFKHRQIRPDLIYIDASHDEADVHADLMAWSGVVASGGCLLGDDYTTFDGVKRAVQRFERSMDLRAEIVGGKWLIRF